MCALLAGAAYGQSNSQPVLKPRNQAPVQELPSLGPDTKVSPDAPVITIQGVCQNASAAPDCKTVITRADFEKIANAIAPNLPKQQRKSLASQYVSALVLEQQAHQMGLDQGPAFEEKLHLQRLQLAARMVSENIQKQAGQSTDQEIDAYYKQHVNDFQSISYDKLYVPKQKQPATAGQEQPASETAMKDEADKLRARAAAGEDFTKLQQQAYDFSGQKLTATADSTRVNNVPKNRFPPSDASVFDLKVGEVSPVLTDPQAYMIYKIEAKQPQPLTDVHDEILKALQQQKLQKASEDLRKTVTDKTIYDNAYFEVPAAPSLRNPGEAPAPKAPGAGSPTPGKK
jgi:hypothetical protein